MESTPQKPALVAAKAETIVYWTVTTLFCLQMSFTAYAELCPGLSVANSTTRSDTA